MSQNVNNYTALVYYDPMTIDIYKIVDVVANLTIKPQDFVIIVPSYVRKTVYNLKKYLENKNLQKFTIRANNSKYDDDVYSSIRNALYTDKSSYILYFDRHYPLSPDIFDKLNYKAWWTPLSFSFAHTPKDEILLMPKSVLNFLLVVEDGNFCSRLKDYTCLRYPL